MNELNWIFTASIRDNLRFSMRFGEMSHVLHRIWQTSNPRTLYNHLNLIHSIYLKFMVRHYVAFFSWLAHAHCFSFLRWKLSSKERDFRKVKIPRRTR
jgi:hypothetical protein